MMFVEMKPPTSQNESLFIVPDSFHGDTYLLFFSGILILVQISLIWPDFLDVWTNVISKICYKELFSLHPSLHSVSIVNIVGLLTIFFSKVDSHHFIHVFHS